MKLALDQVQPTSLDASEQEIERINQQIAAVDRPGIPQSVTTLLTEIRELDQSTERLTEVPQLDQRQRVALPASKRNEILADMQIEATSLLEDRDHELFDLTERIDDELSAAIARGDNQSAYLLGKALGDYYTKLGLLVAAISVYRLTDSFALERLEEAKSLLDSLSPLDIERAFRKDGIPDQAMLASDTSLLRLAKDTLGGQDISRLRAATRHSMAKRYIKQGIEYHATWQADRILASITGQILDVQLARTLIYRQLITEDAKAFRQLARERRDGPALMQELAQMAGDTYRLEPINNVDAAYRIVFNCHFILTKLTPFYKVRELVGHRRMCKRMSRYNYLASSTRGAFRASAALVKKEAHLNQLGGATCIGFHFDTSAIIK